MKINLFTSQTSNLFAENRLLKFVIAVLALAVIFNSFMVHRAVKHQRVVIVPPKLTESIEFVNGQPNEAYAKAMIRRIASLATIYTPAIARKQFDELIAYYAPEAYPVLESELSTTNLNVATEPPIDQEADAARPEGMTDDEWSNVCNLTSALRLTSISLWINMRKRECSSDPSVKTTPSVKQKTIPSLQDLFPLCPDSQRAIPNVFLRSAIFSATQGKTRRLMNNELVPSQGGYEVRISTLESLEQSDLDVWLQSVHLARCSPLGTACEIKAYPFLEGLGRSNKGRGNYKWLKDSLRRLQNTLIEFKAGSKWIRFNLINQAIGNEETKNIILQFDPLLMKLFVPDILEAVTRDGSVEALAQIGIKDAGEDLVNLLNDKALDYSKERSAELVGMKYVDGELVENPNAEWAISESTREMVRSDVARAIEEGMSNDDLADLLAENYAFSDERAEMIARTETAFADVAGNMTAYRESGVVESKKWITGADCCPDCQLLDGMVVGLDEDFPNDGGDGPPLHPMCRCDVSPVVSEDNQDTE